MSKHTPGPWLDEPEFSSVNKRQVSAFATNGNRTLQIVVRSFTPDEDARLIAAAPDLLAALKLHDLYKSLPTDRGGDAGPKGTASRAWENAAIEAIAKAEGQP